MASTSFWRFFATSAWQLSDGVATMCKKCIPKVQGWMYFNLHWDFPCFFFQRIQENAEILSRLGYHSHLPNPWRFTMPSTVPPWALHSSTYRWGSQNKRQKWTSKYLTPTYWSRPIENLIFIKAFNIIDKRYKEIVRHAFQCDSTL